MLNFFKKLFGKAEVAVEVQSVEATVAQPKTLEFHEEIRQQVEAEKSKPAKVQKPAVKAKTVRNKKAPSKIKAEAKPAPAKKKATPKKSK